MLTMKARVVATVTIGLCLVTLAGLFAQQRRASSELTGADYYEIQQLSARYGQAIDSCSDNGYDYARLYTTDGVFIDMWSDDAVKQGGTRWQGREKLREIASGANFGGPGCTSTRFNGSVSHLILNLVITPSPEGARGNSYLVELGGRDPNHIQRLGNYEDVYVKTPEGWRFKTRTHTRAPNGTRSAPQP
jgi:hypothetical protein